jgi:crotonobetainyl-CoA:carnitine CoA-transferase CaiB-like acyl-CoA transferase
MPAAVRSSGLVKSGEREVRDDELPGSEGPATPSQGLEGLRVLELGELVSAAFAAKLMADLGADVVKIEEPGGDRARTRGPFPDSAASADPEQSGLFLAMNTSKRGATLDLASSVGRQQLAALIAQTDILIHNYAPARMRALALDFESFARIRPSLVMCSITPFGLSGPHRDYRAEEITVAHGGGWGWLSPGPPTPHELPPLKAFGHQADFQAGLAAATAALAARYRAQHTGVGEHIDLSSQAYIASLLEQAFVYYTYPGLVAHRAGTRGLNPWGIYRCADGLIFVCTIEEDQWQRLLDFMGRPDWAELEIFDGFANRYQNADALRILLQEWIAPWKVDDLFHEGQKRRICFAPVLGMAQLAAQEHLAARDFFVQVDHPRAGSLRVPGAPYRLRDRSWQVRRPAPLLGEHNLEVLSELDVASAAAAESSAPSAPIATAAGSGLPLEGVRVADFSWVWAGPFCALHLAHLGAEVIKVESSARPDLGRRLAVFARGDEPGINRSGYFNQWNQGKRSVCIQLADPAGVEVVKRLVAECDVVVENFATGVMERLGLGYETLLEVRPDLVMASISGYGQTGPLREYMGYGPAISPLSGLSSLSGYLDGEPSEIGLSLGDPAAGIAAAAAICAALVSRSHTGRGQHIDVSLWESMAMLVSEGWMEYEMNGRELPRIGNRDPQMSPHGLYRCAGDDDWVTIACATDSEWRALCGRIDPVLADDPRYATAELRKQNEDALDQRLGEWTQQRERWDVTRELQRVGVAAFPCMTPKDLALDPHLEERGFFARLSHPEVGVRQHAGIPWRLTRGPNGVRTAAPCLGADTEAVMRDVLGYDTEEIARLREQGILD